MAPGWDYGYGKRDIYSAVVGLQACRGSRYALPVQMRAGGISKQRRMVDRCRKFGHHRNCQLLHRWPNNYEPHGGPAVHLRGANSCRSAGELHLLIAGGYCICVNNCVCASVIGARHCRIDGR